MDLASRIKLNNGVEVPILGLGTYLTPPGSITENAVLAALNAGYRHIDTAALYRNEADVGRAIKESNIPREEIFVTTKLWNDDFDDPIMAFNESLSKLGIGYVDLYLMHFPVQGKRLHTWGLMESLLTTGKCKSIGVCNFTIRHLKELIENTSVIPAINQVEFSPFLFQKEMLEYCKSKDIVVEAYTPLTRGKRLNDPKLLEVAKRYPKTPAQILIRWAIQHELVVIPKSKDPQRIAENAKVFDFHLSDQDMALLDGFNENYRVAWDPTAVP